MTREQQRKLKALKTALPKMIQTEIKKFKLKRKDFMVWFQKEDLFFDLMISVCERDGRCYCDSVEQLKPLWIDDLLWDLLGMPENKKEVASLRAIGAFTVYGPQICKLETELSCWELEELETCVTAYIEHFYQDIRSCGMEQFQEYTDREPYHRELRKALSLVHDGQYRDAIDHISTFGRGSFCNKGIWINDAIIEYCKGRL